MATMTEVQWKAEKTRLTGAVTRARTKLHQLVTLADKIAAKADIKSAEDALRQHKLNYFELTNA